MTVTFVLKSHGPIMFAMDNNVNSSENYLRGDVFDNPFFAWCLKICKEHLEQEGKKGKERFICNNDRYI